VELIDTHIHLYAKEFNPDRDFLIQQALEAGVTCMLLPNIDQTSVDGMNELTRLYPGICRAMMGLHPCYVEKGFEAELEKVEVELRKGGYVAVGEIGMDRHWSLEFIAQQQEALKFQLKLAHELDLPVALHTRNANDEVIAIILQLGLPRLRGVFHCFSGSVEQAMKMTDLGFMLGIGGVITYKNSGIADAVKAAGIENLVLETDAPYLAPVPHRGKRNQPAYIREVAVKLAEVLGITPEKTASITASNARKLFCL
jgi:TatD DNase family protein